MRKFAFILAALIVAGVVQSAQAANRLQTIRSAVPKIVETATKTAGKIGDDISSFIWKNKAAITTGVVLTTIATSPELVAESAVAVANGPPTVIVQNGDPTGERTIVQYEKKRVRSTDWSGYVVLIGLIVLVGLVGMYQYGGRLRTVAKVVGIMLLVGFVVSYCGVVRADNFTEMEAAVNVPPWGWRLIWDCVTNLLILVLLLLVPVG